MSILLVKRESPVPEFVVVGAARAGTTALHYALKSHPALFLPGAKEPNFYAFDRELLDLPWRGATDLVDGVMSNSVRREHEYIGLFDGARRDQVTGEISPMYLSHPFVPRRISQRSPSTKIVCILREPVARAYSHFVQQAKSTDWHGDFISEFENTLTDEVTRIRRDKPLKWSFAAPFVEGSLYGKCLARYYREIANEQICVVRYSDLRNSPAHALHRILTHLQVRSDIELRLPESNRSGIPKSRLVDQIAKPSRFKTMAKKHLGPESLRRLAAIQGRISGHNLRSAPDLPNEMRRRVYAQHFAEDVGLLETLVGESFAEWKAGDAP